jgi:hypothetical protein
MTERRIYHTMFDNDPHEEQKVLDVLGADVLEILRRLPDGVYVVDLEDGGVIKFGESDELEPTEKDHDDDLGREWWTATRYEKDGDYLVIYEGPDLAELGRIVTAGAAAPTD